MQSDGVSERSRDDEDEFNISLSAVVGACLYTTEFQNSTIVPHTYASIPLSYFFWFCVVGLVLGIILRRKALGEISPLSAPPSYRGPLKKRAAEEPQPRG